MTFKATENMFGQIKEAMLASGTKIKCTAKEHTIGLITENTWVHIKMIKKVVQALLLGQMVANTSDIGWKINNMDQVHTHLSKLKQDMEYGKPESVNNGSIRNNILLKCTK